MLVHIIHADDHVLVRLEEDGAIVSEERRKELERSRLSLSIGALPVKMVIGRRGTENRFRHRPLHGLHCRRHDEDEEYWAFACSLAHSDPIPHLHLFLAKLEVDHCVCVQACHQIDEVVGQTVAT